MFFGAAGWGLEEMTGVLELPLDCVDDVAGMAGAVSSSWPNVGHLLLPAPGTFARVSSIFMVMTRYEDLAGSIVA